MECYFCHETGSENAFSYKICEFTYGKLYLYKEQIYPGRVIFASKRHVAEYFDLPEDEVLGFMNELTIVSKALQRAFRPDKLNYCSIGDSSGHLHIHIVPKMKDNEKWGDMFEVNAHRGFLEANRYREIIEKLKNELPRQAMTVICE